MSARADSLIRTRNSILAIVEAQTAAWESAGCPPTFSVDGESYQWDSWLTSKLDAIDRLDKLIQKAKPFARVSRARG